MSKKKKAAPQFGPRTFRSVALTIQKAGQPSFTKTLILPTVDALYGTLFKIKAELGSEYTVENEPSQAYPELPASAAALFRESPLKALVKRGDPVYAPLTNVVTQLG